MQMRGYCSPCSSRILIPSSAPRGYRIERRMIFPNEKTLKQPDIYNRPLHLIVSPSFLYSHLANPAYILRLFDWIVGLSVAV